MTPASGFTHVQPPLFRGGALALTLQALLDPDEETVLFVVAAEDVPSKKLVALWSSSPQPFEDFNGSLQEAFDELVKLLFEHSGPFA